MNISNVKRQMMKAAGSPREESVVEEGRSLYIKDKRSERSSCREIFERTESRMTSENQMTSVETGAARRSRGMSHEYQHPPFPLVAKGLGIEEI